MAELRKRIGLTAERYVLFIGGADPRKNHQIFLEAAEMVMKKLGSRMLVLVGSPYPPVRELSGNGSKAQFDGKGSVSRTVADERSAVIIFLYRSVRLPFTVRRVWNACVGSDGLWGAGTHVQFDCTGWKWRVMRPCWQMLKTRGRLEIR